MLVGFSFKNILSFFEENVFSMRAVKNERFQELNTFKTEHGEFLKSAIIYGANASGKTNLMHALSCMQAILLADFNQQSGLINSLHKMVGFIYHEDSSSIPCGFEIEFIQNNVFYRYGFEIKNHEVDKEYLFKKNKRETPIFERSSPDWVDIKFYGKDMENVLDNAKNTRRDNLFLYVANGNNNEVAMRVYKWFKNLHIFTSNEIFDFTMDYLEANTQIKDNILKLIKQADNNITEFEFKVEEKEFQPQTDKKSIKRKYVDLKFNRKIFNSDKESKKTISTPAGYESSGTLKLFELSGAILNALQNGSVIFIDEIDSSLHPLLVRYLIELFNSIHNNPNNAQLICNTHDILLLEEDIRRDQIYLTEKNEFGMSSLYSLCEFKGLRKESKLLKLYLLGTFGAIPKLKEILINYNRNNDVTNE